MTSQSIDAGAESSRSYLGEAGYVPYVDYKDSDIEWMGEIPAHWELKRLKVLARNFTVKADALEKGDVYIALENIKSWTGEVIPSEGEEASAGQVKRFQVGDILFGKLRPYLAKVTRAQENGVCVSELLVLRPKTSINNSFLEQKLRSRDVIELINSSVFGTKMPRAEWEFIGNVKIAFPSDPEEQRAIAIFLDHETMRIDTLVEKQERLIDLLQERRITLISRTVTKGLNPDVPMKDSGIEWLGEIPAHWEVKQLGQIGTFKKCNGGTKADESPHGIPCVRYGDLYTYYDFFIKQSHSYVSLELVSDYTPLQYGDILFAGSGETLDEIAKSAVNLIDTQVCCGGDVILFRADIETNVQFMGYAVGSPQAAHQKARMGRGITVMHIYGNQLKHLSIGIPPIDEQRSIAAFLDHEVAKIDNLISKISQVIKLQKEFRSALISAAVTGKMDVRGSSIS